MRNVKNKVLLGFGMLKMSLAPISMVIFVISESKYVGIKSFKAVGGILLLGVYPEH